MVLHGLLLLEGYLTELNPVFHADAAPQDLVKFTTGSSISADALWLVVGLCVALAAILFFMQRPSFWIPSAIGIVILEVVILVDWENSRLATVINVAIFLVVVFLAGHMYFQDMVDREIKVLLAESGKSEQMVTSQAMDHLPENIQRWLYRSGVVGKKMPHTLRVVQAGTLRTKPHGRWMPFEAVQYFSIDPPGFIWSVRIKAARFFEIGGRDKYFRGQGHMLIKPGFLFTAENSMGKEIDQGALLRYLAEMAWFPQGALSKCLRWESIDQNNARVSMEYQGVSASGTFNFNAQGLPQSFQARRYGEFEGMYRKENWRVSVTGYKSFNGVIIGHRNEVTWLLTEGDFTWLKMEIMDVQPLNPMS